MRVKHAREMLIVAVRDLDTLRILTDVPVTDEVFGFNAQQAAEKLFKAWIALLGKAYPITHNLNILLEELRKCDAEVEHFSDLSRLNPYAVEFRYTYDASATALSRPETIQRAEALLQEMQRQISECDDQG